jgi:hypothetical protein
MASYLAFERRTRSLSSLRVDPSKLVTGLTREKLESNPAIEGYLKANFPEAYEEEFKIDEVDRRADTPGEVVGMVEAIDVKTENIKLNIRSLTCYLRDLETEEGSRSCRRLRREDMIPGLLYGSDPTLGILSNKPESKVLVMTPWKLLQREIDRYHRSFESRVYDLTILENPDDDSGGTVHRVQPRNVQKHPVKSTIYCANFFRYHSGRPIEIPVVYINEEESSALKRDGFIIPLQRCVEVVVEDGAPIPEMLELECTGLKFKEVIKVDRLLVPDGVRFSPRVVKVADTLLLGVVSGRNREPEEETVVEAKKPVEVKKPAEGKKSSK